jgi:enamine deaminase RidA (YjgF/YER057c/UK114 family)
MSVRRVLNPAGLPDAPGWSHGVSAGGWVFGSGMLATGDVTGLAPEARPDPRQPWAVEPLELESGVVLDRVATVLAEAGSDLRKDLLRVWQWIPASYDAEDRATDPSPGWPSLPEGTPYARTLATHVGDPLRSSTGVGVRQVPVPDAMLAVDFIAAAAGAGVTKTGVQVPDHLPAPKIGYSPAIRHGDWVFMAGFGATDFAGDWQSEKHLGEPSLVAPEARVNPYIWLGSEIEAQTRYTLQVMSEIAQAAGTSLERCVKADVTLVHAADFAGMDRVWREFFGDTPPARTVNTGARPVIKGLRVEVALLLLADDAESELTPVVVENGPTALGHAVPAMHAGDFLFTSSLLPVDPNGAVPQQLAAVPGAPYFRDPMRTQTEFIAEQVATLCEAAGTSLDQVCKVQAFLADLFELPGMLTAWRQTFPAEPPALSAVAFGGTAPLLLPEARVQWDVIAYAPR